MQFRVVAMSNDEINALSLPQQTDQPEAIPYVLYDTLTYLAAGTTASLKFFQQNIGDPTITNVQGGSLPQGQNFRIARMLCDIQAIPQAVAGHTALAAGALNDVAKILKVARGIFNLHLSQKEYGPIPLSFAHASGGETGFGWGTFTAEAGLSYANNGTFDGGFPTDNSLFIKTKVAFDVTLGFNPTAISADTPIRFNLAGTLYRYVL